MRPFGAIAQPKMTPYGIISAWGDAMYFQRIRDVREDHDKTQQEIADMLHRLLSMPVIIADKTFKISASVPDGTMLRNL